MTLETLIGENLAAPIGAIFNGLHTLFPNEEDRLKAETTLEMINDQPLLYQALINQAEANSGNKFASSWRPLIGYICGTAFAWSYVIQPMLLFMLSIFNVHPILPVINISEIMPVLLGMLGLGTMRTIERLNDKVPKGK